MREKKHNVCQHYLFFEVIVFFACQSSENKISFFLNLVKQKTKRKIPMHLVNTLPLPGLKAQLKMATSQRLSWLDIKIPDTATKAAVLAMLTPPDSTLVSSSPDLLYSESSFVPEQLYAHPEPFFFHCDQQNKLTLDWRVLLIRRSIYPGVHSGQIALPGGQYEPEDIDLWHTALS